MDRGLFYATGGLAFVSSDVTVPTTAVSVDVGNSIRWGGTVGVGAEYALSSHWMQAWNIAIPATKAEHITFRDINIAQGIETNQITARLAYKF